MGLFKKRQRTEAELETMRSELRILRERLEASDAAKADLGERLGRLDADSERLNTQMSDVANKVGAVEHDVVTVAGSIQPAIDDAVKTVVGQTPSPDDVEVLRSEVTKLAAHSMKANASDELGTLGDLRSQLEDLTATLQRQQLQIADVALVATDAAERADLTHTKIDDLGNPDTWAPLDTTPPRDNDAELRKQLGQLAEKVATLDSRVNQVSLELTNQLSELSTDLDRAGAQTDTTELVDQISARLAAVTGGQERLANEQARYAIQFREDLAELADRLRKGS